MPFVSFSLERKPIQVYFQSFVRFCWVVITLQLKNREYNPRKEENTSLSHTYTGHQKQDLNTWGISACLYILTFTLSEIHVALCECHHSTDILQNARNAIWKENSLSHHSSFKSSLLTALLLWWHPLSSSTGRFQIQWPREMVHCWIL